MKPTLIVIPVNDTMVVTDVKSDMIILPIHNGELGVTTIPILNCTTQLRTQL